MSLLTLFIAPKQPEYEPFGQSKNFLSTLNFDQIMAFLRSGKFFRFLSAGKNLVNFREYEAAQPMPAATCVCSAK